jgi:hypothetical protein
MTRFLLSTNLQALRDIESLSACLKPEFIL